ncbi:hypothetical protein [Hymenobacter sp. B81]|uniref:hypothetical protein n=1 Tax=Hymenobacter sp. B81 TaxID=3344878 RepID=UPI0037DCE9FB
MLKILIAFLLLVVAFGGCVLAYDKLSTGSTRRAVRRVQVFAGRWGGSAIILVGLVLWFAYPLLAFLVQNAEGDGNADGPALMDVGVFQTILLATIRAVAIYCFSRLLVKKYWPAIDRFLNRVFVRAFYRLTEWQKVIVSLWVLSLFVYLCAQLTH